MSIDVDLVYALVKTLPVQNIANVQRKIVPLLQIDLVGVRRSTIGALAP